VLLNLFFNALEAMPHGGALRVQATVLPRSVKANGKLDSEEVAIMVTDTGTGIAADHLGQIFRPFFTTKIKEGMGLGLSICESIMIAHGGRITVDSRIGQGTTFSLFFPVTVI
jgi:two-component system sensor histidine kinase HydH